MVRLLARQMMTRDLNILNMISSRYSNQFYKAVHLLAHSNNPQFKRYDHPRP